MIFLTKCLAEVWFEIFSPERSESWVPGIGNLQPLGTFNEQNKCTNFL